MPVQRKGGRPKTGHDQQPPPLPQPGSKPEPKPRRGPRKKTPAQMIGKKQPPRLNRIKPNRLFTRVEATRLLGMTPSALANLAHRGEGPQPSRQAGDARVYYKGRDLLEWVGELPAANQSEDA